MDAKEFEQGLQRDGFEAPKLSDLKPNHATTPHNHPFEVRALVLEGEIALTFNGARHAYRAGDIFTMAAGCEHAETVGPQGVKYVYGCKQPA